MPFAPNAMNFLLKLTAIIEAAPGLGLAAVPAVVIRLLLGAEISGASIPLGRLAGAALLALGGACWLARDDTQSRAARGLVAAMLLYNVATVAVLAFAGIGLGAARRGVVAGSGPSRGDSRLVCRVPAAQSPEDESLCVADGRQRSVKAERANHRPSPSVHSLLETRTDGQKHKRGLSIQRTRTVLDWRAFWPGDPNKHQLLTGKTYAQSELDISSAVAAREANWGIAANGLSRNNA